MDLDQPQRYAEVSNDWSAHHFDLESARRAGFDHLFAHGLCTMAMCAHAVVALVADGDPSRVRRVAVRFASPTRLDEDLTVDVYEIDPTGVRVRGDVRGRGRDQARPLGAVRLSGQPAAGRGRDVVLGAVGVARRSDPGRPRAPDRRSPTATRRTRCGGSRRTPRRSRARRSSRTGRTARPAGRSDDPAAPAPARRRRLQRPLPASSARTTTPVGASTWAAPMRAAPS